MVRENRRQVVSCVCTTPDIYVAAFSCVISIVVVPFLSMSNQNYNLSGCQLNPGSPGLTKVLVYEYVK